jgi:excisionase family DNA binding protein
LRNQEKTLEKKIPQAVTAVAYVSQPPTVTTSALMTPAQAAAYMGIEVATLAVWRCTGRYTLPYLKVGRLVRYRQSDLDAFLKARSVGFVEENQ